MDSREKKKLLIIDKARYIFLQKGLFNTVMDDIANEVGLTRRTLYRYFETKEELAYETTIQLLNEWNDYHETVFRSLKGDSIERFETFLMKLIDYMAIRIDVMKYLGEFDFYFKDERTSVALTDSMERFNNVILKSDALLTDLLVSGIKDGSMKTDMNVSLMVATISNVLWSFGQRIAIRGDMIHEETGIEAIELIKKQVEIYVTAIKKS